MQQLEHPCGHHDYRAKISTCHFIELSHASIVVQTENQNDDGQTGRLWCRDILFILESARHH